MRSAIDILLIEDNPADIELTVRALQRNRLTSRLVVLEDGHEALEFVFGEGKYAYRGRGKNPRLILLDLKLPRVDGLEVLRRLKSDESTRMIPIVVLTSSREERDVINSYHLGVNSYIVKPVEYEKFVNSVREIGLYWLLLNEATTVSSANVQGPWRTDDQHRQLRERS